jgi:8-oxo-dGTP pyrophosphatase MutT (NUDIX family)
MMEEDLFFLSIKAIIRNEQGDILLLKGKTEDDEYWDFPGGRARKKERIDNTLQRAVLEETGLRLSSFTPQLMILSKARMRVEHGSHGVVTWVHLCEVEDASAVKVGKHEKHDWVSSHEAVMRLSSRYPEEMIDMIKNL